MVKINDLILGPHNHLENVMVIDAGLSDEWMNYCFSCKKRWRGKGKYEEQTCPICGAVPCKVPNVGVFPKRTQTLIIADDSGQIFLDVFDNYIDALKVGDKVQIRNAFAKEWLDKDGKKQYSITPGKEGTLRLVKNE